MKLYTDTTFDNPNQETIYNRLNELISPRLQPIAGETHTVEMISRDALHVICYNTDSHSDNSKQSCTSDFKVCFYDGLFYIKYKERIFFDRQLKILLEEFTNFIFKTVENKVKLFFSGYTIEIVDFPPSLLDNP